MHSSGFQNLYQLLGRQHILLRFQFAASGQASITTDIGTLKQHRSPVILALWR